MSGNLILCITRCVASKTDPKFNDGSQQDCCEFIEALFSALTDELEDIWDFQVCINSHYGSGGVQRFFHTPDGKCPKCKSGPQFNPQLFKFLQLSLPNSGSQPVTIETLLTQHFSVQTQDETIKCSVCCPHPGSTCPHTGDCARKISSRNVFTEFPQYLFIQLLRSGFSKNMTLVEMGPEVYIADVLYQLVGIVDHRGSTIQSGHYVAFVKNQNGQLVLCDDNKISPVTLEKAVSKNNYVILLKKSEPLNIIIEGPPVVVSEESGMPFDLNVLKKRLLVEIPQWRREV